MLFLVGHRTKHIVFGHIQSRERKSNNSEKKIRKGIICHASEEECICGLAGHDDGDDGGDEDVEDQMQCVGPVTNFRCQFGMMFLRGGFVGVEARDNFGINAKF